MTSSLITQKREYFENEKRYPKKENATLPHPEKPFKSADIIFYFIGTLSRNYFAKIDKHHCPHGAEELYLCRMYLNLQCK